jgi:hypothetical protein
VGADARRSRLVSPAYINELAYAAGCDGGFSPWPLYVFSELPLYRQAYEDAFHAGLLSAALAARDRWLKAIAVPEANAREAAILEVV